ncbi:MAG: hypothetical protein ABIU07_13505 [Ramlibacter sp.]
MKQSLRKTRSHLLLAYKHGEASDSLTGRNFMLEVEGREMTLHVDLTSNLHTRNKAAASCLDGLNLIHHHGSLKYVQCSDNLVRTRMVKAWERVEQPQLRMCLDFGPRGQFLYSVLPHSLFAGGIQFDVVAQFELPEPAQRTRSMPGYHHSPRNPV